jgi:hypothetical protein
LTDPVSGWQYKVNYQDASVLNMWQMVGDNVAQALFTKLIADGKLPAGTLSTTTSTTADSPPNQSTPA